ncbi:MAG: ribosome recycling factor [Magnetococcales bacterium]|nr:ribosome recycling factor [Magnetococcales bacterium]
MVEATLKDCRIRMKKALVSLHEEVGSLRAGRATTSFLDNVQVNAYGSKMPLNQVATLNVPEPRLVTVQPWDKGLMKAIEKSLRESDLGINPISDGALIRVPMPELTEDRRKELVKLVHKYGEQAKIAIRNIRRDVIEKLRKAEKNKEISQDDMHQYEKQAQDLTNTHTKEVDEVVAKKEADVMQV